MLKSLSTTDYQIYAGARKVEQVPQYNNVKAVHFDVDWTPEEMAKQLHGIDAIINVSGSGGKSLLKVDLYGAVKLMQAAEKEMCIRDRYLMLTQLHLPLAIYG